MIRHTRGDAFWDECFRNGPAFSRAGRTGSLCFVGVERLATEKWRTKEKEAELGEMTNKWLA